MSTAALGSAGAGEPPHLADRTTNTPTTWRLYSPLCCSRAGAAAALPPPAPGRRAGVTGVLRSKTYTPLLATAAAPVAPRAPKGHLRGWTWQWPLEPRLGSGVPFFSFFLPPPPPRVCVCVCLSLLVLLFFFPVGSFAENAKKIPKLPFVHQL